MDNTAINSAIYTNLLIEIKRQMEIGFVEQTPRTQDLFQSIFDIQDSSFLDERDVLDMNYIKSLVGKSFICLKKSQLFSARHYLDKCWEHFDKITSGERLRCFIALYILPVDALFYYRRNRFHLALIKEFRFLQYARAFELLLDEKSKANGYLVSLFIYKLQQVQNIFKTILRFNLEKGMELNVQATKYLLLVNKPAFFSEWNDEGLLLFQSESKYFTAVIQIFNELVKTLCFNLPIEKTLFYSKVRPMQVIFRGNYFFSIINDWIEAKHLFFAEAYEEFLTRLLRFLNHNSGDFDTLMFSLFQNLLHFLQINEQKDLFNFTIKYASHSLNVSGDLKYILKKSMYQ